MESSTKDRLLEASGTEEASVKEDGSRPQGAERAWWHETRHYCASECMTSIVDYSFACGLTERNTGQSIYLWFDSAGFCVGTRHGPALSSCTSMGKALRR